MRIYDGFAKGPFMVFFRYGTADRNKKPLSLLAVVNRLAKVNVKFEEIEKYSWNTWQVIFESRTAANNVLKNNYVTNLGFTVYIPGYKLGIQGRDK